MITRHRRPARFSQLWLPVITAGFLGYFGFHAFSGSYGVFALGTLEEEKARLQADFDRLRAEHADLDRRVGYLRPDSLDADIVDVEARSSLNMLRPDEVVISFGATQHFAE